jgi:hypothetical protein
VGVGRRLNCIEWCMHFTQSHTCSVVHTHCLLQAQHVPVLDTDNNWRLCRACPCGLLDRRIRRGRFCPEIIMAVVRI